MDSRSANQDPTGKQAYSFFSKNPLEFQTIYYNSLILFYDSSDIRKLWLQFELFYNM